MPDRIEKIMDKALPVFQSAVTARASRDESLEQLLPVGRDEAALPYQQEGALGHDDAAVPGLRKLKGTFAWAYELAHGETYSRALLELPERALHTEAARFAQEALELERRAVFCELRQRSHKVEELDGGTLEASVRELGSLCRFIGSSEYASEATKSGLLIDVKRYPGGNPPDTVGMVVRLDLGPVVRRLADGLTLRWTRLPGDQVRLELSEHFFLDRPDQVHWFQTVAPPVPATPPGATAASAPAPQAP